MFFLLSSLYRSVRQKPYLTGTLYSAFGYLRAYFRREPRFGDRDMVRFVRSYQMRALRTGKAAAAEWAFRNRCDVLDIPLENPVPIAPSIR